jgi:hypothetical protein
LRIDELEAKGETVGAETTLRATWDVTGARMRIGGTLGGMPVNAVVGAPEIAADAVWMQIMQAEGLWSGWDGAVDALRVGFDETVAGERESLVRGITSSALTSSLLEVSTRRRSRGRVASTFRPRRHALGGVAPSSARA